MKNPSVIWLIVGVLIGAFAFGVLQKQYSSAYAPAVIAPQPNLTHITDSLENATTSTALLLTRDSLQSARNSYRQLLGKMVFGDTVKAEPRIITVIEKEYVTIVKRDTTYLPNSNTPVITPQYGLRLPYLLNIKNEYVGLTVDINKDTAVLTNLSLYGTVTVDKQEKQLTGNRVQRSIVFTRSNPYVTNFQDAYVEEPRLTQKGLFIKQARVAAWTIPVIFAATYLSYRQGWLK